MEGINGHGYLYIIYSLYSNLFHFKTLLLRMVRIHKQVVGNVNVQRHGLQSRNAHIIVDCVGLQIHHTLIYTLDTYTKCFLKSVYVAVLSACS